MYLKSKFYEIKLLKKGFWFKKNNQNYQLIYNKKSRISNLKLNNLNYFKVYKNKININTDIVRSIPLFYIFKNKKIIISDNPYYLISKDIFINKKAKEEYLNYGFCFKERTLINNLFQIPPYSNLIYDINNNFSLSRIDFFRKEEIKNKDLNSLKKELDKILNNLFNNLDIKNKKIIVPLSGGYDSRLILIKLIEKGYKKNLICFTYGRKNDLEVSIFN